ncbi:MAG: hypothetical protein ABID64_04400 [Nitrospirota bacterium]
MNQCPNCKHECSIDEEYKCKNCGEVFWRTQEAFEKHHKEYINKIKSKQQKKEQVEEYVIDKNKHKTAICDNCKKETIISEKRGSFPYTHKEKYFCDHCGNFMGKNISGMILRGIIETLGAFGAFIYFINTFINTNLTAWNILGLIIVFTGYDGLKCLFAGLKARSDLKNKSDKLK